MEKGDQAEPSEVKVEFDAEPSEVKVEFDVADDQYQKLKAVFLATGKGRRPNLPTVDLNNRLLIQLLLLKKEGVKSFDDTAEFLRRFVPIPFRETVRSSRLRYLLNQAQKRAGKLTENEKTAFLAQPVQVLDRIGPFLDAETAHFLVTGEHLTSSHTPTYGLLKNLNCFRKKRNCTFSNMVDWWNQLTGMSVGVKALQKATEKMERKVKRLQPSAHRCKTSDGYDNFLHSSPFGPRLGAAQVRSQSQAEENGASASQSHSQSTPSTDNDTPAPSELQKCAYESLIYEMEKAAEAELSEVKVEIDIAEDPWITDQRPQGALSDSAVKIESDGNRNVLDSGVCTTTSHEMDPVVVKTEVKEEADTDWDINPALSRTADTTAAERGQDIMNAVYNSRKRKTEDSVVVKIEANAEMEEDEHEIKIEDELPAFSDREQEANIVQTLFDPADQPASTSPSCSETVAGDKKLTKRRHVCKVCSLSFEYASRLKRHMLIHIGQKDFVCDICDKAFTCNGNLKTHKLIHTGQRDFVCEVCNKAFTKGDELKTHVKLIHKGEKVFVCDVCNKVFPYVSLLNKHKLSHKGQTDFVCDICNKAYTMAYHFEKHKLTHTGLKDFVCGVCSAAFAYPSSLKQHELTHTGRKDFVCYVCDKAFTKGSSLKTHMLIHTGQKDFVCEVCHQAFTQRSSLKSHQWTHFSQKPASKQQLSNMQFKFI